MMELDYTFERRIELARRDSRAEGLSEGQNQGRLRDQIQLICKKLQREKSFEQIVDEMEMPRERVQVIYDTACRFAPEYNEEQIYEALCALT